MSSASSGTGNEQGLADQASAKVQDAASAAQEKAGELKMKGKSRFADQLDTRTTDMGSQARSAAQSLRQSTEQMREQGNTAAANVASQAADGIERVGAYLEQKSGNDMLSDFESFARRRPWAIAGIAMLGGLALSRFLKASSETRYASYGGGNGRSGAYGGGYVGTGYATPYPAPYDDGMAPISRDPAGSIPTAGRPLGPER